MKKKALRALRCVAEDINRIRCSQHNSEANRLCHKIKYGCHIHSYELACFHRSNVILKLDTNEHKEMP